MPTIELESRRSWPTDLPHTNKLALDLLGMLARKGWGEPGFEWVRVDAQMALDDAGKIKDAEDRLFSAEFLLIEEGTTDRVLYRTAGSLVNYSEQFYSPLPTTTDRIGQFTGFVQRVNAEVPGADQGDDTWLDWFQSFERLLQPLAKISDELEKTVEAQR